MNKNDRLLWAVYGYLAGIVLLSIIFSTTSSETFAHWYFIRHCSGGEFSQQYCEAIWQTSIAPHNPCPEAHPVIVNGMVVGCTDDPPNYSLYLPEQSDDQI